MALFCLFWLTASDAAWHFVCVIYTNKTECKLWLSPVLLFVCKEKGLVII